MSAERPPPLRAPAPPMLPITPVSMTPRWIAWVLTSLLMPALPWLTTSTNDKEPTGLIVMTALALLCQLTVTIYLTLGFGRNRGYGTGGIIGMSTVFMIASVAIGSVIWFLGFMVFIMLVFDKGHH